MQNSKRWKQLAARLLKIVLFSALVLAMIGLLNTMLYPPSNEVLQRLNAYDELAQAPHTLVLGSSVTNRGFVPTLYEEITGQTAFNMSTSGQSISSSYFLLENSISKGMVPQRVLLYINIGRFDTSAVSSWDIQVLENLPFGFNRLRMMLECYDAEEYPDALFRCYRARENFNWDTIKANINYKDKEKVNTKDCPEEYVPYLDSEFISKFDTTKQKLDEIDIGLYASFKKDQMDPLNEEYLARIAALCNKHNIDLILFTLPRLPANTIACQNYDEFHDYAMNIAAELNVPFWDLLYVREDVLKVDSSQFIDGYHPNGYLAFPLTKVLAEMVKEHEAGALTLSQYVFDDYQQYLDLHPGLQGIYSSRNVLRAKGLSYIYLYACVGGDAETPEEVEFRVSYSMKKNGGYELLRDWTTESRLYLTDLGDKGTCYLKIEAREVDCEETQQTLYREYPL